MVEAENVKNEYKDEDAMDYEDAVAMGLLDNPTVKDKLFESDKSESD